MYYWGTTGDGEYGNVIVLNYWEGDGEYGNVIVFLGRGWGGEYGNVIVLLGGVWECDCLVFSDQKASAVVIIGFYIN